jgi:hypothetical protein
MSRVRKSSSFWMAVAVFGCLAEAAPTARAQLAVLDSANLEQTSQNLAGTLRILDQARQTVSQLTAVSGVLGIAGAGSGGLSSPLRTLGASMALPVLSFDSWNLPRELQNPNIGSFNSSRDFVSRVLVSVTPDKNKNLGFTSVDAVQRRRGLAFRDAAANGYALSIQQRQTIQPALERAATLSDQATGAATLIDGIRVTNYLLAQIAGEMTAQRQVSIAALELRAAEALAGSPVVFTNASDSGLGVRASAPQGGGSGQLGE